MGQNRRTPLPQLSETETQKHRKRKTERGERPKEKDKERETDQTRDTMAKEGNPPTPGREQKSSEGPGHPLGTSRADNKTRIRRKSGTGSTRTASTNRANKQPIRGQ